MLTALALKLGVSKRLVTAGLILLAVIAAVIAFNVWLSGEKKDAVEKHETKIDARLQKQGRAADQNLSERAAEQRQAQSEARKEFDNATAHLPKGGLTARQRIDLCNELRAAGTDQAVLTRAGCL